MTEGKAAPKIDFLCVQTIHDGVAQKILGAYLGKGFVEVDDDGLFDAEHPERFDFLIESLQKRRRGFGMKHLAGMRLESNTGRHGADGAGALAHRPRDSLLAHM